MKPNLFRIVSLVFVLATVLNMTINQPTYADAASDKQAVNIIAGCKNNDTPPAPGSNCAKYQTCSASGGGDALCQSIKSLNDVVPSLFRQDTVAKCMASRKTRTECVTAWSTCIYNHIKNNTLDGGDAQNCSNLVAQGKFDEAIKPPPPAEKGTTCAVIGIGWIICPAVTFLAQIVDGAYGFVASLLKVQPLLTTGATEGVYTAWSVMRNFANVAFVIAFLIIILSQLTSVGVTNYGIKKLLPRIIVSAVLVNVSYWICAAAIDVSNITGSSVNQVLQGVKEGLTLPNADDFLASGTGWTGIAGGVLAGTTAVVAALYVGLAALLPALVAALFAIVTTFLVLTLRQALIILLVVIAPLAFVAYLLPNTETLFKKWRSLLQTLLVMYPLISLIFGASALASTIVMGTAGGPYKIAIQIMGAAMAVLPLVVVPTLIKTTSGVLGRFGAIVNNPNKGPFDAMRKGAEGFRGYRQNVRKGNALSGGKTFGAGQFKRGYRRELRNQAAEGQAKSGEAQFGVTDSKAAGYVASNTQSQAQINAINSANNARFVTSVANNPGLVSQSMGAASEDPEVNKALIAQQQKAVAEAIKDVELSADIAPGDIKAIGTELTSAIARGDSITARAMQNMLLTSGSAGLAQYRQTMTENEDSIDSNSGTGSALRENLLRNHGGVKGTANDLMQQAITGARMSDVSADKKTWEMSDEDLVHQKPASIELAIGSGAISKEQAMRIVANDQLAKHLDQTVRSKVEDIATRP
jgi:hypothetical protein